MRKTPVLWLERTYAAIGMISVFAAMPVFLAETGARRLPLSLYPVPEPDGTLAVRTPAGAKTVARVNEIAIGGGPFLPAGSAAVFRSLPNLPGGTRLEYHIRGVDGTTQTIVGSALVQPPGAAERVEDLVYAALSVALVVAAAALTFGGLDARAFLAGAGLAGLAAQFAEPIADFASIGNAGLRAAAIAGWTAYPGYLSISFLVAFVARFPADLSRSRTARLSVSTLAILGAGIWVIFTGLRTPGLLDQASIPIQVALLRWAHLAQLPLFAIGSISAFTLFGLQHRHARRRPQPRSERWRARFLGMALAVSVLPTLSIVVLQTVSMVARGAPLLPRIAMSLSYLPLLGAPVALAYASLAPEVQPMWRLARRAALFTFSQTTVRIASILPLAGLLLLLWRNRQIPLAELAAANRASLSAAAAVALLGLLYRDQARQALDRFFFRDREDVREALKRLAAETRNARTARDLAELLEREIGRSLHAGDIALFVRDPEGALSCATDRLLPDLDASGSLVALARERGAVELDPEGQRSAFRDLPEIERHWVTETHARVVLPLTAADGSVLGLLAVGSKVNELPFDDEDLLMLSAVGASSSLALENSLLRSSGTRATSGPRPVASSREGPRALWCPVCARVFSPSLAGDCPEDHRALETLDVPHVLAGKFRFESRIGAGGMGVVYRARDLSLGRFVAIKTLPRVSAEAATRLRREARATARVMHPNLAVIFAVETWNETPMLVLEFMERGTLAARIRRGPLPVDDVLAWACGLAGALEHAHAAGVLHRDIKPSNVGLTGDEKAKLLDFGLASLLEEPELAAAAQAAASTDETRDVTFTRLTGTGHVVGTLPYLAPEAIRGAAPSSSFDLWALAVTLYEGLASRNPFVGGPPERVLNRILLEPAPDIRSFRADCPEPVALFLLDALALEPGRRPAAARELRLSLEALCRPFDARSRN